ncbi:complex I NDUFA9 subunit family protein [Thiocystis violacea]|uniref:complex I NDUFA9 subunit family protein n=1 Tax=Thiocystis violacea TaxID=13725 RepID=UPI0019053FF4|nr:complex I NDUFA9 subunit family protein [Thiocystis violacea]MBK1716778.1 epimerase [Thiocystis violacea]
MKTQRVFVLGGTGFVGRHFLNHLARLGVPSRVPARHPHRCRDLGLIQGCESYPIAGWSEEDLVEAMAGCTVVVNLVGVLDEGAGRTFEQSHVTLPERATRAALRAGVPRFLHLSALGADAESGPSEYLRSKGRGERVVHAASVQGLAVTSFRPSVIFGPGDRFFNRFAGLIRRMPGFLPLACPEARFAPVHVGDVVKALVRAMDAPETQGQVHDLCGPRIFSLRDLVMYTSQTIGRPIRVIGLTDRLSRLQARVFEKLPGKLFTMDNYQSLQVDSLCRTSGLAELGIEATDIEVVVPGYLT